MKTKVTVILAILLACASSFSGCSEVVGTTPRRDGKVVMVLFDVSDTTLDEATRRAYLKDFRRIVDKVGPGDVVVADLISADPLSTSSFPINEEVPLFDPLSDNKLIYEKRVSGLRKGLLEKAEELLFANRGSVKRTKIIDSLQLAARVFETYKRDKKFLVLFSDMVEESDRYNFQRQPLTDASTKDIVQAEKRAGRLPNLAAAKVYVVGAAAGEGPAASSQRFNDIQNFWSAYFEAAGADLPRARYGSSLLTFEE